MDSTLAHHDIGTHVHVHSDGLHIHFDSKTVAFVRRVFGMFVCSIAVFLDSLVTLGVSSGFVAVESELALWIVRVGREASA